MKELLSSANHKCFMFNNLYLGKIVLRKFSLTGISYYLMIIASQNIDERAEIEIFLTQIPQVLS